MLLDEKEQDAEAHEGEKEALWRRMQVTTYEWKRAVLCWIMLSVSGSQRESIVGGTGYCDATRCIREPGVCESTVTSRDASKGFCLY